MLVCAATHRATLLEPLAVQRIALTHPEWLLSVIIIHTIESITIMTVVIVVELLPRPQILLPRHIFNIEHCRALQ